MSSQLEGQVAIVTGAGRGIGRGESLALAAAGARVLVNDLGSGSNGTGNDQRCADQVVAEIKAAGGEAVANYESVSQVDGAHRIVEQAMDTFGRIDVLVNNAGISRSSLIHKMTEDEWDAVIDVNLKGHFTVTMVVSRIFRQQRSGRIVNTASEAGLGAPGGSNYAATKEGIVGFTRSLALELGPYGVTVNVIRPRAATRLAELFQISGSPEERRAILDGLSPLLREVADITSRKDDFPPESVAPLVVYLCSESAAHVNGQDFLVGGGEITLMSRPEREKSIFNGDVWRVDQLERLVPMTLGLDRNDRGLSRGETG